MSSAIRPGAVLGVLGGGQLGRMFILAARSMGYRVSVFAPEENSPAGEIAHEHVRAPYDDLDAVARFARSVEVVTFEFENVPAATAEAARKHAPVRPAGALLQTTQDRIREKTAVRALGIPVAEFAPLESEDDLREAARLVPGKGVVKTARDGYDGKGQRRVASSAELSTAWSALDHERAVLEAWVPFEREVSVVGARGLDGEVALYEPFENAHVNQILDVTTTPAAIPSATRDEAHAIARAILEGLDVVGVLCVEMFVLADGGLVVNELAPRPHNSGHVTIDAHVTSQFEQQVRAACGLPLGSVEQLAPGAAMANLLGDLWSGGEPNWSAALALPAVHLHLYGKRRAKAGRKMGHLSVTARDVAEAERLARAARAALTSA